MTSGVSADTAVELVAGKLYAVGGTVPLDGRISWMSTSERGHQPVSGYLLTGSDSALLVDTGVALNEDEVLAQLSSVLDPGTQLDLFFTRAELDCVGNLGAIANTFPLRSVRAGGVQNPFDSFDSVGLVGSETAELEIDRLLGGEAIALGEGRSLEVITPAFKMLNTFWAYDEETKTLFTSDVLGHTFLADPAYRPVVDDEHDTADYDQLRRNTIAKFWWLDEVVTERIGDEVGQIFVDREVERIAPAHGCILAGRGVVQKHVDWLLQLLRGVPGDPRLAAR